MSNIKINEEEIKAAEAEAMEDDVDVYVHELKKPFSYEGVTYTALHFDFGGLTGNDSLAVEAEMQALGRPVIVKEISGEYQARITVRACQEPISVDTLKALPLRDFNKITSKTKSFLMRSES